MLSRKLITVLAVLVTALGPAAAAAQAIPLEADGASETPLDATVEIVRSANLGSHAGTANCGGQSGTEKRYGGIGFDRGYDASVKP